MSGLEHVAVVIPTLNEAPNIERTLRHLREFPQVLVVDSGSDDGTCAIAASFPNVSLHEHAWEGYGPQKNWAARQVREPATWILFLDADEYLDSGAVDELRRRTANAAASVAGFSFRRDVVFMGTRLEALGTPDGFLRLVRRGKGEFESRGVNERLLVDGDVELLRGRILHDDRKPLSTWLRRQVEYAELEAAARRRIGERDELSLESSLGRRRWLHERVWPRLPFRPVLAFMYFWIGRGLIRRGRAGYYYSAQQAVNHLHIDMLDVQAPGHRRG